MICNRWTAGALLFLALAGLTYGSRAPDPSFTNLDEARARLASAGFCCATDNANGKVVGGFVVSRECVTWSEAATLRKTGKMGAAWKGKAWVTMNSNVWQLQTIPDQAGLRDWGGVFAFGDQELLAELEAALQ